MDAETYMKEHWIKKKVWRNLTTDKHQNRFRTICDYLEGKTFIDVGCGCGHSMIYMKKLCPGHWFGMDFSKTAIKLARTFFPAYQFYTANNHFDLINETAGVKFDSVVCSEVIEHVGEDQLLFDALLSITKKVLIITTPNRRVGDPGHLRIYNEDALMNLFLQSRKGNYNPAFPPALQIFSKGKFFYMVIHK